MSDYFDIDSILASAVKVPCYFRVAVPGYGFLSGQDEETLPTDMKVDLPFWVAEQLAISEHIDMDIPRFFGRQVRNDLIATAAQVDLRRLCTHFFSFGNRLLSLVEDKELGQILMDAFSSRLLEICKYTQSGPMGTVATNDFINRLDETERDLYKIGLETAKMKRKWTDQTVRQLNKASSLLNKASIHS